MKNIIIKNRLKQKLTGIIFIIIISNIFLIPSKGFSQFDDRPRMNYRSPREVVFLEPLVFYNKDSANGRLDLYIEIPMNTLQFKYDMFKAEYKASCEYSITIKDAENKTLADNSFSESILNTEEQQKNVKSGSLFELKQYYLPPGNYKLHFTLKDKNSSNEYNKDAEFKVNDILSYKYLASDIMLLSNFTDNGGKKEITPIINRFLGNLKSFYLFFEVVNNSDSIMNKIFIINIKNDDGKNLWNAIFEYTFNPGTNQIFENIELANRIRGNYNIEITDKDSKEIVTKKTVNNIPPDMPVQRRGYRRNI